jgi:hypothetical protein
MQKNADLKAQAAADEAALKADANAPATKAYKFEALKHGEE